MGHVWNQLWKFELVVQCRQNIMRNTSRWIKIIKVLIFKTQIAIYIVNRERNLKVNVVFKCHVLSTIVWIGWRRVSIVFWKHLNVILLLRALDSGNYIVFVKVNVQKIHKRRTQGLVCPLKWWMGFQSCNINYRSIFSSVFFATSVRIPKVETTDRRFARRTYTLLFKMFCDIKEMTRTTPKLDTNCSGSGKFLTTIKAWSSK